MKTGRTILVLSLATGLCMAGSVQAFCFLKNKHSERSQDYYGYPAPVTGFAPAHYYAYPYSSMPAGMWRGQVQPGYQPLLQDNSQINGAHVWR